MRLGVWSTPRPGRFAPDKVTRYPLDEAVGWVDRRRTVMFVKLALKVVMRNDEGFVDLIMP